MRQNRCVQKCTRFYSGARALLLQKMDFKRKGEWPITKAMESVSLHLLHRAKQLEVDTVAPMALVLSLFFPFYVSVVTVSIVAVMTMVNYRMRAKALEAPYCKPLLGVLIVPFFVSAVYNNYMGMLYSMLVLAAAVCAFYLRSIMTRALFNRMMDAACVASIVCAAVALIQKAAYFAATPDYRPASVFSNANYYGMMIEFLVLIALYRLFTNPKERVFYGIVIAVNMMGLYLCASMSACMGLLCAVLVLLYLKKYYKWMAVFLAVAAVAAVSSLLFPILFPRVEAIDSTFGQRLSIWSAAVQGIRSHLLFGMGPTSYQMIYRVFDGYQTYHCHNLLLDTLLNYGLLGAGGIGLYLFVQCKVLWLRFRNHICTEMNILLTAAFTAVVVHGVTDVTIYWIQTGMLFLILFSSTGICADYVESKLRLPKLLHLSGEQAGAYMRAGSYLHR